MSEIIKIEQPLTSDFAFIQWNYEGLPNDVLSVQNCILNTQPIRDPLCLSTLCLKLLNVLRRDRGL